MIMSILFDDEKLVNSITKKYLCRFTYNEYEIWNMKSDLPVIIFT